MASPGSALTEAPEHRAAAEGLVYWSLAAGTSIGGRYHIREKIADGANAAVYRADDTTDAVSVALKILDPLRGADPVGRLRFEREFEIVSRLSHPGIGGCQRRLTERGLDVLVLEYIEGETLEARLERSRLPVDEAVDITGKLLDALDACHRQGIAHRDLKPANIVLHPERGPVILDFGIAWFSTALNLTRTGAVIGSPQYVAPEVFGSSLTDDRADLYSLGVILFEMLTGRPVHLAESVAELAVAHATETPPLVAALRPEVPPGLSAVVAKAIAPQPEDRFATAVEFRSALLRGAVVAGRALRARIRCGTCATPLVIALPFCPGCGRPVDWEPTPGPFAVQLTHIESVPDCLAWLRLRYGDLLRSHPVWVEQRLRHVPVPLILDASATTAEQLVAEAADIGCKAEIVHARAVLGARIRGARATRGEAIIAGALHFAAVVAIGFVLSPFALWLLPSLPAVVAAVGVLIAAWYVRRPVLVCRSRGGRAAHLVTTRIIALRAELERLEHGHARKLAAAAVARAAPILLGDTEGLAGGAADDGLDALERAVRAARQLDAHSALLLSRPRARLAVDMEAAKLRIDTGDDEGLERLRELEAERDELAEAAVAHDLAAKNALEACADITRALATRTAWQKSYD